MVVAFVGICHPEGEPDGTVSFSFTKREIPKHCKTTINVPVYLKHKHDLGPVGRIVKAWMEKGKMLVAGLIQEDSLPGRAAKKGIKSGILKGLSLGVIHGVLKNNSGKCTDILWREIVDVSVCEEGDLPGTRILTWASKEAVDRPLKDDRTVQPNSLSPYASFYGLQKQVPSYTKEEVQEKYPENAFYSSLGLVPNSSSKTSLQSTTKMSGPHSHPPPSNVPSMNPGKRDREVLPPNIPDGLRAAAQRPSLAQQNIDPAVLAANEALRREKQQQQQPQIPGQPDAKKAKLGNTPASLQQQTNGNPPAENADESGDNSEAQESVPLSKKEYVELLKAKAEGENQAKKLELLLKQLEEEKTKNQEWHDSAGKIFGSNTDAASLRAQFNKENEDRAKAAQGKVKAALKTGKEVKKLLQTANKTPSSGLLDGLQRLDHYNKNPRQLLQKKCRDDVLNLVGWLDDYNQARLLTVASKNKSAAQLEAQLQTTQARFKELTETQQLKKIAESGKVPLKNPPPIPTPLMSQAPEFSKTPQNQWQYTHNYHQTQGNEGQDCWTAAQSYQQTDSLMTTASSSSPPSTTGGKKERFSSFYSKSSVPMSKIDPGPPLRRPPHKFEPEVRPFSTFYAEPVSQQVMDYQKQLHTNLKFGTGQGHFSIPAFVGKEYGAVSVLPQTWRQDDRLTFGRGKIYRDT